MEVGILLDWSLFKKGKKGYHIEYNRECSVAYFPTLQDVC